MGVRVRRSVIDLSDLLDQQSPILLDGAMGTQLALHGLEMGGQNNLTHPDVVELLADSIQS